VKRPLRLALGGMAALVLAGVLIAPVVIGSGGSGRSCAMTVTFSGAQYAARETKGAAAVQDLAVGVGITRGCGAKPENVDVRSLAGIPPSRAVGLSGGSGVWVRRGICPAVAASALLSCLKR
jgi:hypothetical protein